MSGEIILAPILLPAAGVGLAGIAVGTVKSFIDKRVEAAKKKIEAEKGQLKEWESFQVAQKEHMEEMSRIRNHGNPRAIAIRI